MVKKAPQRIVLISPTAHSDSNVVFKSLKKLDWDIDVLIEYSDEILKEKIQEVKKDLDESKEKQSINKLTDEECELLYKHDFEEFENIPEPKYPNGFLLHWVQKYKKRHFKDVTRGSLGCPLS